MDRPQFTGVDPPPPIGSASARLFQRQKDSVPQVVGFAEGVGECDIRHSGFRATGHGFELGDDVFETEGFTGSLGAGGLEHHMDDVDVEMVERRLVCIENGSALCCNPWEKWGRGKISTVKIQLHLILLHRRVLVHGGL